MIDQEEQSLCVVLVESTSHHSVRRVKQQSRTQHQDQTRRQRQRKQWLDMAMREQREEKISQRMSGIKRQQIKRSSSLFFAPLLLLGTIVTVANALVLPKAVPGGVLVPRIHDTTQESSSPACIWKDASSTRTAACRVCVSSSLPSSSWAMMNALETTPNMFLPSPVIATRIPPTLASSTASSSRWSLDVAVPVQGHYRHRGVLGFRVEDSSTTGSTTGSCHSSSASLLKLQATSPSFSTDSSCADKSQKQSTQVGKDGRTKLSWKTLSTWSPKNNNRSTWRTSNHVLLEGVSTAVTPESRKPSSSPVSDNTEAECKSLLYLPWLPEATEVHELSVVQLKEALADRGLPRTGNKAELQDRLKRWTEMEQQQHHRQRLQQRGELTSAGLISGYGVKKAQDDTTFEQYPEDARSLSSSSLKTEEEKENGLPLFWSEDETFCSPSANNDDRREGTLTANSLAEWTRTVDLKPLLQRREAIYREREQGKSAKNRKTHWGKGRQKHMYGRRIEKESSLMSKDEYISVLKKVFDESSQSRYSNYEVKKMYAAAKEADQIGDRDLSKLILTELMEATPHDGRIYRRLSRMEKEEGNVAGARGMLQKGLKMAPDNAYLWHGLAQIASSDAKAAEYYRRAIQCDPSLPMPYHALGTMQHTKGRIASAMKTLKQGLEYCPSNHRLHHALGDIYRDAKMLEMAEKCYRRALKHGPAVSHVFAYNALAFVAYEDGEVDACRFWLRKAVAVNNGRNANGWVALARMEEAEENIDAAGAVCVEGIAKYERALLKRASVRFRNTPSHAPNSLSSSASGIRNRLMTKVPVYRSGDRFFNVYRNWARLEERYGSHDSVSEVYRRAFLAFPEEWKLTLDWAYHHSRLNMYERACQLFSMACSQSSGRHGDPYRCYAEYEMARGNYDRAQTILLRGEMEFQKTGGEWNSRNGMVELYYVWAICEWHLKNLSRAEALFDHAIRLLALGGEEGSQIKCLVLYAKAKLHHSRAEPLLAQHCIGLCLKENLIPAGTTSKVWELWAEVAVDLDNERLSLQCQQLAERARMKEDGPEGTDLLDAPVAPNSLQGRPDMQQLMRRDPWHLRIFGGSSRQRASSYHDVQIPLSTREQELIDISTQEHEIH